MINITQTWKIGNCLELLPEIKDKSIDMILTDLPYGTTACSWDVVIPFEPLWKQYERIIKDNGAIVLTASQPFTSYLIISNIKLFKYEIIWDKVLHSNPLLGNIQPLRIHENIIIFYKNTPIFNKIQTRGKRRSPITVGHQSETKGNTNIIGNGNKHGLNNPKSIITFSNANKNNVVHPTQKPIALFEYLIKTYTNEGDTVHDSCLGSGTTLEACMNTNRNCIGFEISHEWEETYKQRLSKQNHKLTDFTL